MEAPLDGSMPTTAGGRRAVLPAVPRLLNARRLVRVAPMRWFLGAVVLQAVLHDALPGAVWLDGPASYAGLLLVGAALWLALRAEEEFVWNATPVRAFEPPRALVTTGPYRWSRNPMYLSLLLALAGMAVFYGSATPWLVLPILGAVLTAGFVRTEENILHARFGPAYARYRASVRRWL